MEENNPYSKLGDIYKDRESKIIAEQRHADTLESNHSISETIVDATTSIVRYLEGHITQAEVVNQLEGFATTEDISNIASKLSKLDETILSTKLDLKPLVDAVNGVKTQVKSIPETKFEQKDAVKVTNLKDIVLDTSKVEKAIKELDLSVDVKAPIINVEKPDLKPLKDLLLTLISAVNKQKQFKSGDSVKVTNLKEIKPTDTKKIEKKLDTGNKYLKEISEKRFGGGGGGSTWIATNTAGTPMPIELTADGKVPVEITDELSGVATETTLAKNTDMFKYALCEIDTADSTYTYFGKEDSAGNWFIKRMDSSNSTVYAVGTGGIASVWSNRATQSFGAYNTKF